jgi:hypothetical protein
VAHPGAGYRNDGLLKDDNMKKLLSLILSLFFSATFAGGSAFAQGAAGAPAAPAAQGDTATTPKKQPRKVKAKKVKKVKKAPDQGATK